MRKIGKFIDLTGQKFGRLTVIKLSESRNKHLYWLCECECGNIKIISGSNLKSGKIKSCGCLNEEAIKTCNKNAKVLVAIQDLEDRDCNIFYVNKEREEYETIFEGVKTAASICDDFVKQLRLFTENSQFRT